jgi:hypothetical protein
LVLEWEGYDAVRKLDANEAVHGHVDLNGLVEPGEKGNTAVRLAKNLVG